MLKHENETKRYEHWKSSRLAKEQQKQDWKKSGLSATNAKNTARMANVAVANITEACRNAEKIFNIETYNVMNTYTFL